MTRTTRNLVVWLILLLVAAVVAVPGYFLWKGGSYIYKTIAHNRSLPDPVVVQGNTYWFPIQDRVFAVPKKYVRSYGRASTDGGLNNFTLHMLLPNLEGYSPDLDHKFRESGGFGDRLEVMVHVDGRTQEEAQKYWYEFTLPLDRKFGERNGGIKIINEDPHIEWIHDPTAFKDASFLIKEKRVEKILRCGRKGEGSRSSPTPSCNLVSSYSDGIQLYINFNQRYEPDWLDISDRFDALLRSFEQPAAAMPPSQSKPERKAS